MQILLKHRATEQQSSRATKLRKKIYSLLKNYCPTALLLCCSTALILLLISLTFHDLFGAEKPDIRFRKQQEIQQIKPPKPVKIKLHRNNKGEYSWDITGDNVDEIIRADRKLRKLLKVE